MCMYDSPYFPQMHLQGRKLVFLWDQVKSNQNLFPKSVANQEQDKKNSSQACQKMTKNSNVSKKISRQDKNG